MALAGQLYSVPATSHLSSRTRQHSVLNLRSTASHLQQRQAQRGTVCAAQTSAEVQQRLSETGAVVSDQSVPEGHKGLHGFLYGEGGAEAHDSDTRYDFREVSSRIWCN